jgi:hypothetical protein
MVPMRLSQSYSYFEQFSSFIDWSVKRESNSENIDHYLDDFFFAGSGGTNDCQVLLGQFVLDASRKKLSLLEVLLYRMLRNLPKIEASSMLLLNSP